MPRLDLTLTLLDDVVASERPATEGGHASLDYLPGAMLLGAAAARLYAGLSRHDAYTLFHSGKVRFGDATPLLDGMPCWPMPLCWHEKKTEPATIDGWLKKDKVRNLQYGPYADGVQPKQLRDGYVRVDGRPFRPNRALRMKTAIDPQTGRVDEAQLYGYEALLAGQRFGAGIEADDDLPPALWDQLVEALTATGTLLLGRSRSAEYGRVRADAATAPHMPPSSAQPAQPGMLTLWCLSDLALLDERGQPTLQPSPERLGLARGTLDWERSFLRFRRFASWNAYRRGYDIERQVIRRGSVISLTGIEPALNEAERERLLAGVGLYRELGLGRVCLDPRLLSAATPDFEAQITTASAGPEPAPRPNHPLITWLETGRQRGTERSAAERQAKRLTPELANRYRLARAFAGVADDLPIGPSPAQWGTVYEHARVADDLAALKQALTTGENAVCKPTGEGWQDQFRDASGIRCFADWFRGALDELDSLHAVRAFAREAQRTAKQAGGRDYRQESSQ